LPTFPPPQVPAVGFGVAGALPGLSVVGLGVIRVVGVDEGRLVSNFRNERGNECLEDESHNATSQKEAVIRVLTDVGRETGLLVGFNDVGFRVVGFDVALTPPQCSASTPHQPNWLQHCP
jgi:hypothetical protein